MANQEIKLVGNVGQDLTFKKQGDRNLVEFSLICEEYKRTESGAIEVREHSQNWYRVTVWGNDRSLDPLNVLSKGMRIQVSGALKPSLFHKESGDVVLNLAVNCQPSEVLIKPNRIKEIVMRPKSENFDSDELPS